ncbi:Glutamate racemase [Cupriavidus taiwanensis]|uniref:Glutamate racemase n=1 Tax=Cupriavidus taiwanensis TaxID=164546 RepID=A0A7Z7JAR6_9BURK|nr:GLUTAMATE RACEMASE PROTEIN [Cupriavidus taiwanensis]SOZ05879.1 GLUTAMATE RACEMASE PROTEIN [Cupriavidus taiwanensis]SOZ07864.1 GLUTAMATE RACEMASE PROTEIN [Cupriavidus taiwanensis]SPC15900.1 GLUTAMATE RACEMASE PROTEIN [Cupriavidus taiwanensis]SPD40571.1 Glutamate racemase [Cupriavidus taiwanensis]
MTSSRLPPSPPAPLPPSGRGEQTLLPLHPVNPAPIGVFDSGLGGLSVLREIRALLPHEPLLYLADSKYAPYGEKPEHFVEARTLQACEWMIGQGCKALVIACNTATGHAVALLRERLPVPIIGVEPGLKPAAAASISKVVGVLATANTLKSAKFARLLASLDGESRFLCQAGLGLVTLVEQGQLDGPAVRERLEAYLKPMLDAGADTLVLGCTHYPFLEGAIRAIAGDRLALVDTGIAVARQLARKLDEHALAAPPGAAGHDRFLSTKDAAHLRAMVAALLQRQADAETVLIEPAPAF